MKDLWSIFILIIVVLLSLELISIINMNNNAFIMREFTYNSEVEGVKVKGLSSFFALSDSSITVELTNNTDKNIKYGQKFKLYKEIDGKWNECSVVDLNYTWEDQLYTVNQNSKGMLDYYLTQFDILNEGKYKIEQEYYFDDDTANKHNFEIFFTLVQK